MAIFRRRNGLRDNEVNILFVGSLIERKGVSFLIQAVAKVAHPACRLFIVGDGILKNSLEHLAEELGIGNQIVFAGPQAPHSIPLWLKCADIFVLPSLFEGRPNVVLEALAHGVPVIATDIDGTRELIEDGSDGLLCIPGDSDSLAGKLEILINNSSFREKLSRGGKEYILREGLTWENCAEKYLNIYNQALEAV